MNFKNSYKKIRNKMENRISVLNCFYYYSLRINIQEIGLNFVALTKARTIMMYPLIILSNCPFFAY